LKTHIVAKYLTTIIFTLVLGVAGGYSFGTIKARTEMTRVAKELEKSMAQGVLINNSRDFAFLATHLHERGGLNGDPESVGVLRRALETITLLDKANQVFRDRGEFAPIMFDDSRESVDDALEVLRSYPIPNRKD
jgi:hypothetical protein